MKKKKHLIVPIFVSHEGCPYRCSFCNQSNITGSNNKADRVMIREGLRTYLEGLDQNHLPDTRELAFFGGSFTGIPSERQEYLLSSVQPWILSKQIQSIRVSTHALFIDEARLSLLRKYSVGTVELGVQSTDDEVLRRVGRECAFEVVQSAVSNIRKMGFRLGLQLMPGLPGDSEKIFQKSVSDVINFRPDFVRIYPTLVIKNTGLYDMYQQGTFRPWGLEKMIEVVKEAVVQFEMADIPVIRVGLHPDQSLLENYVDGPMHPSFRYLIDSRIARDRMIKLLRNENQIPPAVTFRVPSKRMSNYLGHKKENLSFIKSMFGLESIDVKQESTLDQLELVA
ncbi:MAG: radical SAM protein [Nitrospina sp.]|nr:radical SAM protein [Nitrospina sp.]MBT3875826.1 radical SAM protein [Nitrospina sp.]MBT4049273.1 radical SAM protein [Nitrospina sp.]MBT4557241.1 radical SAM protein [Nitrospina sp.]MBT5347512.1 radical SAM protein [Nitrospina sp.]